MDAQERAAARIKLIEALLALGISAWMLWTMVPEHRRQLLKMGLAQKAERITGSAARRAGAASMGAELATGQQNYTLPYGLSLVRDKLTAAYHRLRGAA